MRKLCRACGAGIAGARDRAALLLGFARRAAPLRTHRAEHRARDLDQKGLKLLIERSKTDKQGEGAELAIPRGRAEETCPVSAGQ